jgi:hypothetical protein
MASYTEENIKSTMSWANSFSRLNPDVLDRTSLWGSLIDAQKYAKGDKNDPDSRGLFGTSYIGQILTVYENDEVTVYKIDSNRNLIEIGAASNVLTAQTYTAGLVYATSDNVGKIISVVESETIEEGGEEVTYTDGLYIVVGAGTLAKIATSTATGDVTADIIALQTRVGALESSQSEQDGACYWETDGIIV